MKNIIFFSHAEKKPSGGAKYIYDFSETINKTKNFSSEVVHIKKKKTSKLRDSINKKLNIKEKKYSGWLLEDITYIKDFKYVFTVEKQFIYCFDLIKFINYHMYQLY